MKMYIIEKYAVYQDGGYRFMSFVQGDESMKRQYLANARKEGYKYNRKKMEYVLKASQASEEDHYSLIVFHE